MARWRLTQKHYLTVLTANGQSDTYWEYKENPVGSRRTITKRYPVPRFLDPEDPVDCNYNPGEQMRSTINVDRGDAGEVIVAYRNGKEQSADYIISDNTKPTLDMIPLDEEAKAISAEWALVWGRQFVDENVEGGNSGRLLLELTETLTAFNASAKPSGMVADDGLADVLKAQSSQINQLIEMNMALMGKLEPPAGRRV